jgi:excisionase family DNA binding protein
LEAFQKVPINRPLVEIPKSGRSRYVRDHPAKHTRLVVEKLALTVAEAAALGGPCRSALYQDIKRGRLRAVKRGRSTRILIEDYKQYLASLPPLRGTGEAAATSRDRADAKNQTSFDFNEN